LLQKAKNENALEKDSQKNIALGWNAPTKIKLSLEFTF